MKTKMKKYPILASTIVSCLIIIVSLFILGFFGMKLGVSLGGGTQIEVTMKENGNKSNYISNIGTVLDKYGYSVDSFFVEDKYVAGEENTSFTKKCLVVQVAGEVDDETATKIQKDISTTLSLNETSVSVRSIVSSVASKSALFLGLAFIIIAAVFFVFGWIRYDIFAGISFVVAFLHNIIVYLSVVILTRIELSISSLSVLMFMTLIMSLVLITIYERFRAVSKQQDADKIPAQERMIESEKHAIKPFLFTCIAVLVFIVASLFIPAMRMKIVALNILIILLVTAYTTLLIGPSTYVATLEIRDMNRKAIMSRNDTVNKAIKKKIKKQKEKVSTEK